MSELSHKRARTLVQRKHLWPEERGALAAHLGQCEKCHNYADAHVYLYRNLHLGAVRSEPTPEFRGAVLRRVRSQNRRNFIMKPIRTVASFAVLAAVVVVVWLAIRSTAGQPVASRPQAELPQATVAEEPTEAATHTRQPTFAGVEATSLPDATPEAATEIPTTAAGVGATSLPGEMLDVEWQLHSVLESERASQPVVPQPENYTIQFGVDGNVAIQADCNNIGATYTVSGSSLTLEMGPTTLVSCDEDSGDQLYIAALEQVTSYDLSEYGMMLGVSDAAQLYYIEAEDVIDLVDDPGGVNVTADVNLQVRTGPGTQFRISHWAAAGDRGQVIGQSPDNTYWVVAFPDDHPYYTQGWVLKSETTISNPENLEIPEIIPPLLNPIVYITPPEGGEPQGKVVRMAPVMTGPDNSYQIWGLTSIGPEVIVTGGSGNWYRIELPTSYTATGEGWIEQGHLSTSYEDLVQDVFNLPPAPDLEARPTASGGSQAAIRFSEETSFHAGPDDSYDTYGSAQAGWVVGIVGESSDGNWWVVNLPPQTAIVAQGASVGWVSKDSGTCSKCDVPSPYIPVYRNP